MITIEVKDEEQWDEIAEEFKYIKGGVLTLEHSLISISKWESKFRKAFINTDKTTDEIKYYIKCMCINKSDDRLIDALTIDNVNTIVNYINEPMTATKFYEYGTSDESTDIVTSEIIYYSMIALNIPMECQKWHLNRLLTLIKVCKLKNEPPKKLSAQEVMDRNARLNAERRKKENTKG